MCEALGKTLKLPPSGSRTIKVKLAISPDSSKDIDTKEPNTEILDWPTTEPAKIIPPSKLNDCCSAQSANTTSTYLPSSHSEKPPKYSSPSVTRSPQAVRVSTSDVRAMPSPKLRPARQTRFHKHDLKNNLRERIVMQMNATDNRYWTFYFSFRVACLYVRIYTGCNKQKMCFFFVCVCIQLMFANKFSSSQSSTKSLQSKSRCNSFFECGLFFVQSNIRTWVWLST